MKVRGARTGCRAVTAFDVLSLRFHATARAVNHRSVLRIAAVLLCVSNPSVARKAIPERPLGRIVATSTEVIRLPVIVRGLSSGVLVNEIVRRRVLLFDSTLSTLTVAIDSGTTSSSASLVALAGDSTLYADWNSSTFLILDAKGKTVRVVAPPRVSDLSYISDAINNGTAAIDARGRLVYWARFPSTPAPNSSTYEPAARLAVVEPDSAPLVRADFMTRAVDTVAALKIRAIRKTVSVTGTTNNNVLQRIVFNPVPIAEDDWAVLSDGSIAVIRARDYHIDWIGPDGTRRSSPKMPFDWRPQNDADKRVLLERYRPNLDQMNGPASQPDADAPSPPDRLPRLIQRYEFPPLGDLPDYVPPLVRGTTKADYDGHVWILPRTSLSAAAGLLYDVVDRSGVIVERVRLPAGRVLVGFAPGGLAILTFTEATTSRLELARIK